jgi:hypothetical protein
VLLIVTISVRVRVRVRVSVRVGLMVLYVDVCRTSDLQYFRHNIMAPFFGSKFHSNNLPKIEVLL